MKKITKEEWEEMTCEKCRRTQTLHGTPCKKHKKPDLDPNQANDSGIEYKFDGEDTVPLVAPSLT